MFSIVPCQCSFQYRGSPHKLPQDKRCAALERLTKMLPKLQQPPRWIALENVKGAFHGLWRENICVKEQKGGLS